MLYPDPAAAAKRLAAIEAAIDRKAAALIEEARAAYTLHAQRLNTTPVLEPPMTAEEKEASDLVVECVAADVLRLRGRRPRRPRGAPARPGAGAPAQRGGGGRGGGRGDAGRRCRST